MFYKYIGQTTLVYDSKVHTSEYVLLEEERDDYTLPVDGWYWFDTLEEAKDFFGITE